MARSISRLIPPGCATARRLRAAAGRIAAGLTFWDEKHEQVNGNSRGSSRMKDVDGKMKVRVAWRVCSCYQRSLAAPFFCVYLSLTFAVGVATFRPYTTPPARRAWRVTYQITEHCLLFIRCITSTLLA